MKPDYATNPDWHLQRFDSLQQRSLILKLSRETYQQASFLDQRIESQAESGFWVQDEKLEDVFALTPDSPSQRMHFIFHVGHCGSTLLSRVLDHDPSLLNLREPLTLRWLADELREQQTGLSFLSKAGWQQRAELILSALGRHYPGQSGVTIKTSSICNNLIGHLLPQPNIEPALLVYIPLKRYLAAMMRTPGRADVRGFARQRVLDARRLFPGSEFSLEELSEAQLMTLAWLTSISDMNIASQNSGSLWLNFEDYLDSPDKALDAIREHWQLSISTDDLMKGHQALAGSYSKDMSQRYTPEQRSASLKASEATHADAIKRSVDWAKELLAAESGSGMSLPGL